MREAFLLALSAKGTTLPNPPVGAVLVRDGRVVGCGATRPAGGPHAEIVALREAREAARGATLYVTLEPCNHFGRTPPCSRALVEAGVRRVVAACADPNPAAGGGFDTLRHAGIEVEQGLWRSVGDELYTGFFFAARHGRPRVTVKVAQSLDGRINARPGERTALTGPEALRFAHGLRARADAILVGGRTVRTDNPDLTPRLTGGPHPMVLVLTRQDRIDAALNVFRPGRRARTVVLSPLPPRNLPRWVEHLPVRPGRTARDIIAAGKMLGLHELLVEGGRGAWGPLLRAGLCDELDLLTAPVFCPGGEPWMPESGSGWLKPLEFHRFTALGRDSLTTFLRRHADS